MNWPWWFGLGMSLLLLVIVLRWGRWLLDLFRAQRDGRVDPDALWPPGRIEGGRTGGARTEGGRTTPPPSQPPAASDPFVGGPFPRVPTEPPPGPSRREPSTPFDPDDLGRPGSPDGPPA